MSSWAVLQFQSGIFVATLSHGQNTRSCAQCHLWLQVSDLPCNVRGEATRARAIPCDWRAIPGTLEGTACNVISCHRSLHRHLASASVGRVSTMVQSCPRNNSGRRTRTEYVSESIADCGNLYRWPHHRFLQGEQGPLQQCVLPRPWPGTHPHARPAPPLGRPPLVCFITAPLASTTNPD